MNIEKLETLKEQWSYKGKPKQWQDGFDSIGKEYEKLYDDYIKTSLELGYILNSDYYKESCKV